MRVGVLGAGMMGRIHARAWLQSGAVEQVTIHDRSDAAVREAADALDLPAAQSAESLIEEADVISVCTPPDSHAELVGLAAAAGTHVLLEKPSARTLAEHDDMAAVVESSGITCMVGTTSRFYPESRAAFEHLREHSDDAVLSITETVHLDNSTLPAWYLDPAVAGGGVLLTNGIHAIDRILWLTQSHEAVVERVRLWPEPRRETFAEVLLTLPSGTSAHLQFVWQAGIAPSSVLRIVREHDTVEIRTWDALEVSGATELHRSPYEPGATFEDRTLVGIRAEIEVLITALRDEASPESDLAEHRRALSVISDAYAKTGDVELMARGANR